MVVSALGYMTRRGVEHGRFAEVRRVALQSLATSARRLLGGLTETSSRSSRRTPSWVRISTPSSVRWTVVADQVVLDACPYVGAARDFDDRHSGLPFVLGLEVG